MNKHLEEVVAELITLEKQERQLEDVIVSKLTEILRSGFHLTLGYRNLFEFCRDHLGYSAGKASRRSSALNCMEALSDEKRENVREKLKTGELTLSHLVQVQQVARKEKMDPEKREEILTKLENTSVRDAEKILIREFGLTAVQKESVRPVTETQSKLTLIVDEETLELLEKFKHLTAHQNPQGLNATALKLALRAALGKKDPLRKPAVPAPEQKCVGKSVEKKSGIQGPRIVAGKLKKYIWQRDKGRCVYVNGVTGKSCGSTYMLQVDHIKEFALGGKTEPNNLRLLCRAHHAHRNSLATVPLLKPDTPNK